MGEVEGVDRLDNALIALHERPTCLHRGGSSSSRATARVLCADLKIMRLAMQLRHQASHQSGIL